MRVVLLDISGFEGRADSARSDTSDKAKLAIAADIG
jgi:hypothetical protein